MKRGSFFRSMVGIAIPVGLQSMLQSSFAMIDQLMAGQLGSTVVAAVEVAGRPAFIYSVVVGAVAAVAGIMISQYLGMEDRERADRALSVNLAAVVLMGAVFTTLCLLFPQAVIRLFVPDDPEILVLGKPYLMCIAWTYLPMGISSVLSQEEPVRLVLSLIVFKRRKWMESLSGA